MHTAAETQKADNEGASSAKPPRETNDLLDKISSRIETRQKPMTAVPGKRRQIMKDNLIGKD